MKTTKNLLIELSSHKLEIEDLKFILLENFMDDNGNINMSGLDFLEFDGNIDISKMKVRNKLIQSNHKACEIIQDDHTVVGGDISQNFHKIKGKIYQLDHIVKNEYGFIYQDKHIVDGNISQSGHNVRGEIIQSGHIVNTYFVGDEELLGEIEQNGHIVDGKIIQSGHDIDGVILQRNHQVKGEIFQNSHDVEGKIF